MVKQFTLVTIMNFPQSKIRKTYKTIWCPKSQAPIDFNACIKSDCCLEYDTSLESWVLCAVTRKKRGTN